MIPPGAPEVVVAPERGAGPQDARPGRLTWTATWTGGAADLWLVGDDGDRPLLRAATSPAVLGELPSGAVVAVETASGRGEGRATPLWTPADVAAWSGPGLRGLVAVDLAAWDGELWVATAGGGLGRWDGAVWRHADRRSGLLSEVGRAVAVDADGRWWADGRGAVRAADTGTTAWSVQGGVHDLALLPDSTALAATASGVLRLSASAAPEPHLLAPGCDRLWVDPAGGWLARCGGEARHLPSGAPEPGLPAQPVGLVARDGGRWVGHRGGVDLELGGVSTPWWAAPAGTTLSQLIQLGGQLLVLGAPSPGWRLTAEGAWPLRAVDGVRGDRGLSAAPGPAGKVWIGTDRGVALLTPDGVGTPLPLAPLPAGAPVSDVAAWGGGAAIAGPTGLAWLGPRAPEGFEGLAAAAGPTPRAVARDQEGGWWVASATSALRLHRGALTRLDLGATVTAIVSAAGRVAFATTDGVQVWIRGALLPSPALPGALPGPLIATDDGALWVSCADGAQRLDEQGARTFALPSPATHLVAAGSDAIAVSGGQLFGMRPGVVEARPLPSLPASLRDGAWTAQAGVWIDEHGGAWLQEGEASRPLDLDGALARGVRGDPTGAWILTDLGLFRVALGR